MNDIESRLAEALAARAAEVEPHDEDDALNSISERVNMNRRRGLTVLGIAAALMVAVGAVALLNRDDNKQQLNVASDSSSSSSSSTPPVTVVPTSEVAIWPFASSGTTFATPEAAAKSFAVDYLGMTNARVGATREENGTQNVEIFPNARGTARTVVRTVEQPSGRWVVFEARADEIQVESPIRNAALTAPLTIKGSSTAFEATIGVQLRPFGSTEPLFEGNFMGGSNGEIGPFSTAITPPVTDQPLVLVLFEGDASGEQTFTKATVITLAAAGSPEPTEPATARERTPEEAIETHVRSFQLEYAGPCEEVAQGEETGKECSVLHEDRGTTRIYGTGLVFSEIDVWLLLTHDSEGWSVTDAVSAGTVDEPKPPPW